jgi:tRNA pseudouridine38-40 synthase
VLWAARTTDEFHARFSARSRRYRYLLLNAPVAPALLRGKVGWYHRPLDVVAMSQALAALLGTHDFSSFRASECQAKTPVKTMHDARVRVLAGGLLAFDFHADAFLHHMIRNIVGALVMVGTGKHPPAWMAELVDARDRTRAPATFAPDGLYLTGIEYDARFGLPAFPDHPFRAL